MSFFNRLSPYAPHALGVLRIASALTFISHGTQKLFSFPVPFPMEFSLASQFGVAALLEIVGGTLLLLGLFTRPVAFVLSGFMAVAFWVVHAPSSLYPIANGGEQAYLFCFIFLYLAFAGGGAWSLDSRCCTKI